MDPGDVPLTRVEALSTKGLLQLYADILSELLRRGVVRSRNAPAGDLAEYLVAYALDGELAPPSEKSWDVRVGDRRLQVKARLIASDDRRSHHYSPFRSWDFESCVFLLLDAHSYDITSAVEVPVAGVQTLARETTWIRGFRVGTRVSFQDVAGAIDRTAEVRHALESLT